METPAANYRAVFFDAVGTLFRLSKSVGYHYALVGRRVGLNLEAAALDRSFATTWKNMPARLTTGAPREDDDKGWWRELVDRILQEVAPTTTDFDRDAFFEAAYAHFAEAGVWELFPEVLEVLNKLHPALRLGVVSNFDGRLRMILEQFGLTHFFSAIAISSEIGADKPDPLIYQRAAQLGGVSPNETLYVGDDPVRDWQGAAAAGFSIFELERPRNSLHEVLVACAVP